MPIPTAFAFEDRDVVAGALSLFEAGSCGFANCLVVANHARHSCDFTATFDQGMRNHREIDLQFHHWPRVGSSTPKFRDTALAFHLSTTVRAG